MLEFDAHGVRFSYPETWTIADESNDERVQVSLQSPGTAFWTLAVFPDSPSRESLLASVEAAYREDYPTADIDPPAEIDGSHGPTLRSEAEFLCLDMIVTATAEAFQAGNQSALVLTQMPDIEAETLGQVFEAITTSLKIEDDSPWPGTRIDDDFPS